MDSQIDVAVTFSRIVRQIRANENYVPRPYQTIGGGWTVDTWKTTGKSGDEYIVRLMDEGYTTDLQVCTTGQRFIATGGNQVVAVHNDITADLVAVANDLGVEVKYLTL